MPSIKAPANLPELVKTAFNKALATGDVTHYATQVVVLTINSIPFQLRFSPSLANKPKPPPRLVAHGTKPPFDPFAEPLPPSMLIAQLGPEHNLVLNKFAVVPEHFILATRRFAPQTRLLERKDLEAAYACIEAYHINGGEGEGERELYAFFNSGEHSGASQPHRHLQLLVVGRMREGLAAGDRWDVLADGLPREGVPFGTFVERLDGDEARSAESLHRTYLRLYRRACKAAGVVLSADEERDLEAGRIPAGDGQDARISYNLGMTRGVFVLCPRRAEGAEIAGPGGEVVGKLALNGTVLAGTALVKSLREWDVLRGDPGQLEGILRGIGFGGGGDGGKGA